jgi:glycosyltransferase involved in cell wall biosynthesis
MGLDNVIALPRSVARDEIDAAIGSAACLLLPSSREGYGIFVDAATKGTPSVVVAGPDNAAVELVDEGRNGCVAPSASARDLGAAIVACVNCGASLRESTRDWATAHGEGLTLAGSMQRVLEVYRSLPLGGSPAKHGFSAR